MQACKVDLECSNAPTGSIGRGRWWRLPLPPPPPSRRNMKCGFSFALVPGTYWALRSKARLVRSLSIVASIHGQNKEPCNKNRCDNYCYCYIPIFQQVSKSTFQFKVRLKELQASMKITHNHYGLHKMHGNAHKPPWYHISNWSH